MPLFFPTALLCADCPAFFRRFVKPGLELTVDLPLLHTVLHIGIDLPVHFGEIADMSGIVQQDGVHCFQVILAVSYGKSLPKPA